MTRIAVGIPIVDAGLRDTQTALPAAAGPPAQGTRPRPHLLTVVGGFPASGVSCGMATLTAVAVAAPRIPPPAPA